MTIDHILAGLYVFSLAAFLGRFSTRRMLREYAGQVYLLPGFEPAPSTAETVVS